MNTWRFIAVIVGIAAVAGLLFLLSSGAEERGGEPVENQSDIMPQEITAHIGNAEIIVEIADDPAERQRGLSGRAELPQNHGLFFTFTEAKPYGFWMKDMRFSLDILWFDKEYRLIHVEEHVTPDTFPTVFRPAGNQPAQYVLEVNAGFVAAHEIKIGDRITLEGETAE